MQSSGSLDALQNPWSGCRTTSRDVEIRRLVSAAEGSKAQEAGQCKWAFACVVCLEPALQPGHSRDTHSLLAGSAKP